MVSFLQHTFVSAPQKNEVNFLPKPLMAVEEEERKRKRREREGERGREREASYYFIA